MAATAPTVSMVASSARGRRLSPDAQRLAAGQAAEQARGVFARERTRA